MVVFLGLLNWFRPTSRELKRLEGISRSPVFASFAETLNGLSSIRAFGEVDTFLSRHDEMVQVSESVSERGSACANEGMGEWVID